LAYQDWNNAAKKGMVLERLKQANAVFVALQ
jgi:hypothetical protein